MLTYTPTWLPKLNDADIPDDICLTDFVFNDAHRPHSCAESPKPFVDSVDGFGYSVHETRQRIEWLAAGLAAHLNADVNPGEVFDRVVSVFALNNIHTPTIAWAVLRMNGVVSPANAAFRESELASQLKDSGSIALFTCLSKLDIACEAADLAGIPRENVFLIPIPGDEKVTQTATQCFSSIEDLISKGRQLINLPHIPWVKGQARRQVAYLCYSSGTSGTPKGVMVSHFNIIANIIQMTLYESTFRSREHRDVILGVLPQSHIYSVVLMAHVSAFRGDAVVTMAKFDLMAFIRAIQRFQMTLLYVVPPILINLAKQSALAKDAKTFDLPSVRRIYSGAAPLTEELTEAVRHRYPGVIIGQGYGMTEAPTVIASHPGNVFDGSSGCIIPGVQVRILDSDGNEVASLNTPGELYVKGPQISLGYYNRKEATQETFSMDGWLRTGDEVEIRLHPETGDPHLFVVDRTKELIKVSGFQVAPAELEGHLLGHPIVSDCAVIPVPNERSGEVPKALVVLRQDCGLSHKVASEQLIHWVAEHKSKQKSLRGGVEFISEVPKSPSGKILRRLLRDRERAKKLAETPTARL
ncbi:phenylacetyl- ligase [Fusarium acutatum]|uniref:Phenylacetyl- ligase n=1 Tax=Fusarium acutatum TaxID=78861 RepID=A0A8H4NCV8_9HYPO|nr:phenylacetyl- ligase [Fusarium acutatum]